MTLAQPLLLLVPVGYAVLLQNLLPLVIQVAKPILEVAFVVLFEGGVNQRKGEKLSTLVQIGGVLATAQEYFREKVHVLFDSSRAVRSQKWKARENILQRLFLVRTVQ